MDTAAAAISDPVRRDILLLLRDEPLAAGEIAEYFDISRPAISRHLRVLRECGLVVDEAHGRHRVYRLDITPLAAVSAFIDSLSRRWSDHLDALETEVYRTRRERRAATTVKMEKTA